MFLGISRTILSEYLLRAVLKLLHKEVAENGRNLHQYFSFFWTYANLGLAEVFLTSFFLSIIALANRSRFSVFCSAGTSVEFVVACLFIA